MLTIDEFTEILRLGKLPGEEDAHFHTLGGFVMMHVRRVPAAGDHFIWGGLRFEVMDMDGNRVDKVLVAPLESDAGSPPSGG
jgi:putative hemolysin